MICFSEFIKKIVVEAADLVNAVLIRDPNIAIRSAVGMDRNRKMCADDVLYSSSGITECLLNFVDVIPKPATTASQVVVKRAKHVSEFFIAQPFLISLV